MRFPNDVRLAENTKGIHLILGGHDHVYDVKHVSNVFYLLLFHAQFITTKNIGIILLVSKNYNNVMSCTYI